MKRQARLQPGPRLPVCVKGKIRAVGGCEIKLAHRGIRTDTPQNKQDRLEFRPDWVLVGSSPCVFKAGIDL